MLLCAGEESIDKILHMHNLMHGSREVTGGQDPTGKSKVTIGHLRITGMDPFPEAMRLKGVPVKLMNE